MFDSVEVSVGAGAATDDATGCAAALTGVVIEQRRVGARRLALAVRWADLHDPDLAPPADATPWRRRSQRVRQVSGAEGTPYVSEFAVTELGMLLQTSTTSAQLLLRDALELRHRMPRLWQAVMTGRVEDWKARKITGVTRVLSWAHALVVDEQVTERIVGLPFGRVLAVVEGAVVAVDPAGHEARRAAAAGEQYVALTRDTAHGLRTLTARGQAGDLLRLQAVVDHLAVLLAEAGDESSAGVRKAKALALLADPARACVFLADAATALAEQPEVDSAGGDVRVGGGRGVASTQASPETDPRQRHEIAVMPARGASTATCPPFTLDPALLDPARRLGELLRSLGQEVLDRLRPVSVLHLHLAGEAVTGEGPAVVRGEELGALSLAQLAELLGTHRVTVAPVLDPLGVTPVDAYEIPTRLRAAVTALHPFEVFPYGTLPSRSADLDHTIPYDPGGPPGQTRRENLGPLGRHHHRAKTFGDFQLHQPLPGLYLWRTPTGHWYRVDHRGTTPLGTDVPEILCQGIETGSRLETAYTDLIVTLAA